MSGLLPPLRTTMSVQQNGERHRRWLADKNLANHHGRLQTRTQYVQLREADLEKKKQYCKSEGKVDS